MLRWIELVCIIWCIGVTCSYPQTPEIIATGEAKVNELFLEAGLTSGDSEKEQIYDTISQVFDRILALRESFDYPFSSIKNIGKIYSPDMKIRIYTWNLPYADGTNRYYGFVQFLPEKNKAPLFYRLTDKSDEISDPWSAVTGNDNWYGNLVYEITQFTSEKKDYYILLGYDPQNRFISGKLIDVLFFDSDKNPVFGNPVFYYNNRLVNRVLFEYSANAQMNLRWAPGVKMIVFDHLSPEKPSYEGNYQYYGPDFSYDAFKLEDGIWKLTEDIDIRKVE